MKIILKLSAPVSIDRWLWKNIRWYRRHQIARRKKIIFPFEFRIPQGSMDRATQLAVELNRLRLQKLYPELKLYPEKQDEGPGVQ